MDARTLRRKLKQFVDLGNELDAEAKRRYGTEGLLFHEGDGVVCIMSILPNDGADRHPQQYIKFAEDGAQWGAGAF